MSESSIQLQTQVTAVDTSVSLDSAGRPIICHASSQARRQTKYKPRFAEFSYNTWDVCRYAILVTKAVIPMDFWGGNHNFQLVMQRMSVLPSVVDEGLSRHTPRCEAYGLGPPIRNPHCASCPAGLQDV
ncbi:hypothetical protein C8T65DRAFT_569257 [Cerioporus squamosus]|nr:hypothetical protein C8T65DRAFT_569257 [Cerioporus squamosus]